MKRFLVLLLVAVMAVPALFADVTVGGWGRIILEVKGDDTDGSDVVMDMSPNWNLVGGRTRFQIAGSSDQIGFNIDVDVDYLGTWESYDLNAAENASIWIKPIDMIKIQVGSFQIDTLRGKFGATANAASSGKNFGGGDFEDWIFPRTRLGHGVAIHATPVDGLNIILAHEYEFGVDQAALDAADLLGISINGGFPVDETLKSLSIAAGYTIEGIGMIRAGYFGSQNVIDAVKGVAGEDGGTIVAAFNLTAVEGLNVDLGGNIYVGDGERDPMIALGVSYQIMDALSATLISQISLNSDDPLMVGVRAAYSLGAVSINLEVNAKILEDANQISVYPFARMGLGNGYTSAGFRLDLDMTTNAEVTKWALPVAFEYWF